MKKKNLKKLLLAVCCAALLVCVSIGATVAYLTSKGTVTNTFTVGKVTITLDEAKVNLEGVEVNKDGGALGEGEKAPRVTENAYKLLPGHEYTKDPTIHVADGSEECWLFVEVDNGISSIEQAGNTTIAAQMATNGWSVVDADRGIYAYKESVKAGDNVKVFESFKIDGEKDVAGYANAKIVVTAAAIQKDGFSTAAAAWAAAPLAIPTKGPENP